MTEQVQTLINKIKAEKGEETAPSEPDPEIRRDLVWVWTAYIELDRTRSMVYLGEDAMYQPISYGDIHSYARLSCIADYRSISLLKRLIPAMDRVYMEPQFKGIQEAQKKRAKQRETKSSGRS